VLRSAPNPEREPEPELGAGRPDEAIRVHAWRVERLESLGIPGILAEAFADRVDWHTIDALIAQGCSPALALEIAR
jgi:hypothetical protein